MTPRSRPACRGPCAASPFTTARASPRHQRLSRFARRAGLVAETEPLACRVERRVADGERASPELCASVSGFVMSMSLRRSSDAGFVRGNQVGLTGRGPAGRRDRRCVGSGGGVPLEQAGCGCAREGEQADAPGDGDQRLVARARAGGCVSHPEAAHRLDDWRERLVLGEGA